MKTVCIYHSIDLDGWMSAAIVKHWFIENVNRAGEEDLPVDNLDFIGYNYGQPLPDLSAYDKIIMCDISFKEEGLTKIFDKLLIGKQQFIWIDHHISAIKEMDTFLEKINYSREPGREVTNIEGLQDTKFAACELTWKYFFPNEAMPEIVRLLGRYDCFGHKGTDEELKVLEFQYGAREAITDYQSAYNHLTDEVNDFKHAKTVVDVLRANGASIYRYLCTDAKQIYKNGFEIELYLEGLLSPYDIGALRRYIKRTTRYVDTFETYKFICINKERFNPINFGIDYHKEGYDGVACFHYDAFFKQWRFSLYNDNGKVNCSLIAQQFGGGGHKGAAGFTCDTSTLLKILNEKE